MVGFGTGLLTVIITLLAVCTIGLFVWYVSVGIFNFLFDLIFGKGN